MRPIPLAFRPHFKPVVWGGRRLREVFGADCPDERVGEAWLVSDREGAWSRVAGGAHDGRTLGEVVADDPEGWLGRAVVAAGGATFPLLVKLIDAATDLSVQVHPDDATARELGGSDEAKSECWSILEA
ncbi:MAG: mannose-6-phosphate isomerase, partial [Planctomycetes bacterium]|nr:mannose-6-phosphate isomerase [Planctomycetota bacterium]